MTLTFEPIINPIVLSAAVIGGSLAGFLVGTMKRAKAKATIARLESDLVQSNHETLEAQKALVALEARLKEQVIPVIPMKLNAAKESTSKEKASK